MAWQEMSCKTVIILFYRSISWAAKLANDGFEVPITPKYDFFPNDSQFPIIPRLQKYSGMKIALKFVASPQSIEPTANDREQNNEKQNKKGGRYV
jgi:hypothetical protein